jgi:2-keto-4-pentenoate hydratase
MRMSAMHELGATLAEAWIASKPIPSVPERLTPERADEAYQAQAVLVDRLMPHFGPIVGWKVGAAGPSAEPNAAPLLADLVQPAPARFGALQFRLRGLEAELAFRFGRALPPRSAPYGEADVAAAIQSVHVGIEVVECRTDDREATSPLVRLADNQNNGAFCFGPVCAKDWRSVDYARQAVVLSLDGIPAARAEGGNAAGHPMRLLVWLANHAAKLRRGIAAGDIITTGSHIRPVFNHHAERVEAKFAGLGSASLNF